MTAAIALGRPAVRQQAMHWSPTVLSLLITVGGVFVAGVAILGQWRWQSVQALQASIETWKSAAEANAAMVESLTSRLATAQAETQAARLECENLTMRMDTLEHTVANGERQTPILQTKLDRAEAHAKVTDARNLEQHPRRSREEV